MTSESPQPLDASLDQLLRQALRRSPMTDHSSWASLVKSRWPRAMRKFVVWLCCVVLAASSVSQGHAQDAPPPPPESPPPPPEDVSSSDDDGGGGGSGGAALAAGGAVLVVGAIVGGLWAAGAFSDNGSLIGLESGTGGSADRPITIRVFGDAGGEMREMEMGVLARVRLLQW